MKFWYACNLCVVWQYHPCDMYIHFHTIGLIDVTEKSTVTCHFAPNRRRFHWSIPRWILLCRRNIFGKSLKASVSLFVPSFRFFQHLENMIASCICWTGPFEFRWLKEYIHNPSYYRHQIGSIHLSHCCHIFPWLCVWDGCTIIFCHLLHIYPGNTGTLFPLLMFSLWYLQMIGYIMACRSCSFVCRLHHLIIIIMQTYLKALNY